MNKKIKKLLFELSRDTRITTKELGKKIKTTQQSSSYLIKQLKKKKIIKGTTTIVDGVKLGLTNIIVCLNYLTFDTQIKKEILDELKSTESIISIEEAKQGVDLIIEYASSNLSSFNKTHSELIQKFNKNLETKFIFPVIVKHIYLKNYLTRKFDKTHTILYGDRVVINLSESEFAVLSTLIKQPNAKLIEIAKLTSIPPKTVAKIKKNLEKKAIIKGYSCIFDNQKLGINRDILFIRLSSDGINDIDKLIKYTKYNKNIIGAIKIIGEFHLMLIIEELKETDIIKDIRSMFSIHNYLFVKSENIDKESYLPIGEV